MSVFDHTSHTMYSRSGTVVRGLKIKLTPVPMKDMQATALLCLSDENAGT